MANQYQPDKKTIGGLLALTSPTIEVPDFQRNFSWTSSEVDTFWSDLQRFDSQYPGNNLTEKEYFLGSLVFVSGADKYEVLDGQQRLATATILLSVIRDYVARFKPEAGVSLAQEYIDKYSYATKAHIYKLTMNRFDKDFFRREIQEARTDTYIAPTPDIYSHVLIRRAREYFESRFDEQHKALGEGEDAFNWAQRIALVLTDHVSVVVVSSTDADNASAVFETLNDRGIGLSTPDLVRMLLLQRANPQDYDGIMDSWSDVLELESDAKVRDFLLSRDQSRGCRRGNRVTCLLTGYRCGSRHL